MSETIKAEKPTFETIDEYEAYIDKIFEMIQARIEQINTKLEDVPLYMNGQINLKYQTYRAAKDAYADTLTFFSYAESKTEKQRRLTEKVINGTL